MSSFQHLCSLRTPHCLVSPTLPAFLERAHISVNQEANSASRPCHALGLGIGENCGAGVGWRGEFSPNPFLPPDYRRASFLPCPHFPSTQISLCASLSLSLCPNSWRLVSRGARQDYYLSQTTSISVSSPMSACKRSSHHWAG